MFDTALFDSIMELMVNIASHEDCLIQREREINCVIQYLLTIPFNKLNKNNRIYIMDMAIKFGHLDLVKAVFALFEKFDLLSDLSVPSAECSTPFRPSFWLASIVKPYPLVPIEAYSAIERFMCDKLKIPSIVQINDRYISRAEYLEEIAIWKSQSNNLNIPHLEFAA